MANVALVTPSTPTALQLLTRDYLASCRARGLAPTTIRTAYAYTLDDIFLPWCAANGISDVAELDQRTLDRFTADLLDVPGKRGRQLSRHTVHHCVRVVRQFLHWCRKEGEGVTGEPQLPRLPKVVIDVLSRDEIDRLELFAPTERDKLILRLLADTGIRVGELCGLELDDVIAAQDRRAFVKVRGKGAKERLVPLAPPLVRRIERYVRVRPVDARGTRLFIAARRDANGEFAPLTSSGVLQLIRAAADRAGMTRRIHPHLFRHSFATEALRRGMNPVQLAQLLGHSGLRMIEQVYAHLNADDGYDAVLRMLTASR
jgi:integrase/recombinase XerD